MAVPTSSNPSVSVPSPPARRSLPNRSTLWPAESRDRLSPPTRRLPARSSPPPAVRVTVCACHHGTSLPPHEVSQPAGHLTRSIPRRALRTPPGPVPRGGAPAGSEAARPPSAAALRVPVAGGSASGRPAVRSRRPVAAAFGVRAVSVRTSGPSPRARDRRTSAIGRVHETATRAGSGSGSRRPPTPSTPAGAPPASRVVHAARNQGVAEAALKVDGRRSRHGSRADCT